MILESWQHHYFIFTQRLVGLLVKSVDFSNLCFIMPALTVQKTLLVPQVCIPVTQEV